MLIIIEKNISKTHRTRGILIKWQKNAPRDEFAILTQF